MKIKTLIICMLIIGTAFSILGNFSQLICATTFLANDTSVPNGAPVPDDYQFEVLDDDHAVIGIRPEVGNDFNIEVYTDTTFTTLIENSTSVGDVVDFVVLDKTTWASPPNRSARVTYGTTSYVIEMENDVDDYSITDTWGGAMNASPGNPVLSLGPPGYWDDYYVYTPTILYDGIIYHMWYEGRDGTSFGIGYATSPDCITWTKSGSNPLLTSGPSPWESQGIGHPTVIYNGTTYQMWYGGVDGSTIRIGYATSPEGITWTKYAGNPVLDVGPSGSWDEFIACGPMVLYNGTTYQMWYHGHDGSNYRIGYATSPDGITWAKNPANPVLDIGPPGSWDDTYLVEPTVLYDGVTYHMWYGGSDGSNGRIGYATSPDGITWTKNGSDPVLDIGPPSSWDDTHVGGPTVLHDGTTYHMWYAGHDGANYRIGYATSPGWNMWTKIGANPVLDLGPPGSWEDTYAYLPVVLYDGLTYRMWYSGWDGAHRRLGYATSSDGVTWTKHPSNPVLDLGPPGSWDEIHAYSPSVLYDGTIYHMWYTGADNTDTYRIGYATSPDGIIWTKSPANPVLGLGPPGTWEDNHLHSTTVLYDGLKYHMWYGGDDGLNWRIGYATSPDGITWTKSPANPVLDLGPPGSWDDTQTQFPSVLHDGVTYQMWYTGNDGTTRRIGYATSSDGILWTKSGVNPVLELGPPGSWDDYDHAFPSVLYDGTTYHIWYGGKDGTNYRIGYATSPDINRWTKLNSFTEVLDAYEIIDITSDSTYTITLDVPPTADLDLFIFSSTGGRDDAVAASTNIGVGINESISLTALTTGDYLLVITNEDGGTGAYTVEINLPPVADAGPNQTVYIDDEVQFNGSNSSDPDGTIEFYEWDFDANDGLWWETGAPPDAVGPTPTHTYDWNGLFIVTLKVTDNDGLNDTDTCEIMVLMPPPLPPFLYINVSLDGEDVILYWDPPLTPGIDHYLIYRSTSQSDFDFKTIWKNTSADKELGEPSPIPLRTMWNDTNATLLGNPDYQEQYYYVIRSVNTIGEVSRTSRTVGKWTKTFLQGVSTFSSPLEPIDILDTDNLTTRMNADYIKYMDSVSHTWVQHNFGDGGINNTQMKLGEGYEVKFDSQATYTFTGLPGAMISYDDDTGFLGFNSSSEATNLTITIENNGDVNLTWQEPASMGPGDWYEVYYSNKRDGFFGAMNLDYFYACPPVSFGTPAATHIGANAYNPGVRLYYMVVPFNASGVRGSSTYSIGIWTEEYLSQYDTIGLPLKLSINQTVDWYCDNIPDTVGINYYNSNVQRWSWHSARMPEGAYDPIMVMTRGYQISTSNDTKFSFIGI